MISPKTNSGFNLRSGGFTLTELVVVVSIMTILTVASITGGVNLSRRAQMVRARDDVQKILHGILQYQADVGSFPTDVARGVDPGLVTRPAGVTGWNGPYIDRFPDQTPWKGEYDYNDWPTGENRVTAFGTCNVPPGLYLGIQTSLANPGTTLVPQDAEQYLTDLGYDDDGCINGEVQALIHAY